MTNNPVPKCDEAADSFGMLSPRTARLLQGQGLTRVDQVATLYPEALLDIRGFGFKSLREVEKHFLPGQHYDPRTR